MYLDYKSMFLCFYFRLLLWHTEGWCWWQFRYSVSQTLRTTGAYLFWGLGRLWCWGVWLL